MKTRAVVLSLVHNAVGIMTPFLLAATGGLYTELSGMLNIALEGLMLVGAFFGVVFAGLTGSLALGVVLGIASSLLAALLFGLVTLKLKANVFIAGLATNLLASGLTVVLAFQLFKNKGVVRFELGRLPVLYVPALRAIPLLGDLLLGHNVLVYVSWAIVLVSVVVIYRTPFGLRLRGTGLGAPTIASLGLRPQGYQLAGILISGLTCGLAGAVHDPEPGGLRAQHHLRPGLDRPGGHLPGQQDPPGDRGGLLRVRPGRGLFQLRPGGPEGAGGLHPGLSLRHHGAGHDPVLDVEALPGAGEVARARRGRQNCRDRRMTVRSLRAGWLTMDSMRTFCFSQALCRKDR